MKTSEQYPNRRAFTMIEFAKMFGRKRGWAYKLKSKGKLKVIEGLGEIMVPVSEVERLLGEEQN